MPPTEPSETTIAAEIAAIGERLAALASMGGDAETIGPELGAIRAHLKVLAEQNEEVAARLGPILGVAVDNPLHADHEEHARDRSRTE
jgi:hypothetical protein